MDAFTWQQLGILASALIGVLTLAVTVWKLRAADLKDIYLRIDAVQTNNWKVSDDVRRELATFQLHVAMSHPTANELKEIETRITNEVRGLAQRIDQLLMRASKEM